MRYRMLSPSGDYVFGSGSGEFLVNTPQAVGQAVLTRLRLWQGEWFLDLTEGTPYTQQILGFTSQSARDQAIQARILGTPGVTELVAYSSTLSPGRQLTISATLNTIYGQTALTLTL